MKKLACLFAAAVLLAGCGSGATPKTGTAESKANEKGQVTKAEVTVEGDKFTKVSIDDTYEGSTKKTLKDDYGMKKASAIGKEWWEQAEFLENFIVKNGIDKVGELKDGVATNKDVLAGCTMGIESYITTIKEAQKNAK